MALLGSFLSCMKEPTQTKGASAREGAATLLLLPFFAVDFGAPGALGLAFFLCSRNGVSAILQLSFSFL